MLEYARLTSEAPVGRRPVMDVRPALPGSSQGGTDLHVPNPLAVIRLEAGYTSAEAAAKKLGRTVNHIYNVERGRCGASDDFIEAMAKVYGRPADTIREAISKARRQLLKRQLSDA